MSCKIVKKQPFGCGSPYQRLHMNSCKYSCRKLLLVFPFIFINFSFAALQLLHFCMLCINTGCLIHKINRVVYSLVIIVSFSVVMFPCKCEQCHITAKTFPGAVNTSLSQDSLGGSELRFIGWLHGRADNRFSEVRKL